MTTKEEDFVEDVLVASSHDYLMFFTNMGKVYTKKVYRIPEASRTAKGSNVVNILEKLAEGEFVTSMISVSAFSAEEYLTMVTEKGVIKRTQLSDFEEKRKGGKIAIALDEEDHLLFVRHTKGDSHLIVATRGGRAIRFAEDDVRCMGRQARGVRGIRMAEGDVVVGVTVVDDEKWLLTVTENGLGKLSAFEEFTAHNRGGQGVRCHDITEKTGLLTGIGAVHGEEDLMMITDQGTIIRTPASDLPVLSRSAAGVIVMRLPEEQYVANFTIVAREDDKDDDGDGDDGVLTAETEITTDMDGMEIELPAMETDEE
jgi:DNA gyrase subunit A